MKADLIQHWGDDLTVVNAARVSFDKESSWEWELFPEFPGSEDMEERAVLSDKDKKLIHYLAKNKHTSCFEHQGATFRLKVPIFVARQIQRHRTFSYNEVSRRYVDTEPEFFWPDKWRKRADNVKQGSSDEVMETMKTSEGYETTPSFMASAAVAHAMFGYNQLLQAGVAPELARMILPQNMYTEFYMSGNLRAWAHFLQLRLDGHAQKEVRDVAQIVANKLEEVFPVSMKPLMESV